MREHWRGSEAIGNIATQRVSASKPIASRQGTDIRTRLVCGVFDQKLANVAEKTCDIGCRQVGLVVGGIITDRDKCFDMLHREFVQVMVLVKGRVVVVDRRPRPFRGAIYASTPVLQVLLQDRSAEHASG